MAKMHYPKTPAIHFLQTKKIPFSVLLYSHEEHGGTSHAAVELQVAEHVVIKTLVMEMDATHPFLALMHGDREVSVKQLARELGVKRVSPCNTVAAHKHTGYLVGGISPFGTRTKLPVYVEASILSLQKIYINGGKRGLLVEIDPQDLHKAFPLTEISAAQH